MWPRLGVLKLPLRLGAPSAAGIQSSGGWREGTKRPSGYNGAKNSSTPLSSSKLQNNPIAAVQSLKTHHRVSNAIRRAKAAIAAPTTKGAIKRNSTGSGSASSFGGRNTVLRTLSNWPNAWPTIIKMIATMARAIIMISTRSMVIAHPSECSFTRRPNQFKSAIATKQDPSSLSAGCYVGVKSILETSRLMVTVR